METNVIFLTPHQKVVLRKILTSILRDYEQGQRHFLCLAFVHYAKQFANDPYEHSMFLAWFTDQEPSPTQHEEFYNHPLFNRTGLGSVWWQVHYKQNTDECYNQRKLFLEHLLNITLWGEN